MSIQELATERRRRDDQDAVASFAGLDEPTARLAYLESYACVERILREYGRDRVERLIEEVAKTRSIERALQRALRTDLAKLEAQLLAELD